MSEEKAKDLLILAIALHGEIETQVRGPLHEMLDSADVTMRQELPVLSLIKKLVQESDALNARTQLLTARLSAAVKELTE